MTVYEFQANHPAQPARDSGTPQHLLAPTAVNPHTCPSGVPAAEQSVVGLRAAARLHDLREISLPAAVAEAAAELLEASGEWCADPVARDAMRGTVVRLRQALGEQPAWL
ncbi:hypothetical protein [Saccharothrix sp. ST-888]|uniref:hypothetical protein n=1 Tax=Saccharothrix sp. ST-888 TaxID=1427391 RepID=UPI0005ED3AB1|nr:hypothetical protein [Saccharothrix sp. ST-888]KJK59184.1 hypothetical protein UK12_05715 [Saccharothrix sp. ST-888]